MLCFAKSHYHNDVNGHNTVTGPCVSELKEIRMFDCEFQITWYISVQNSGALMLTSN